MKGRCESVFKKTMYYFLDWMSMDFYHERVDGLHCERSYTADQVIATLTDT